MKTYLGSSLNTAMEFVIKARTIDNLKLYFEEKDDDDYGSMYEVKRVSIPLGEDNGIILTAGILPPITIHTVDGLLEGYSVYKVSDEGDDDYIIISDSPFYVGWSSRDTSLISNICTDFEIFYKDRQIAMIINNLFFDTDGHVIEEVLGKPYQFKDLQLECVSVINGIPHFEIKKI